MSNFYVHLYAFIKHQAELGRLTRLYHAEMAEPQNRQTDKNVIFGLALIKNVYR